MENNGTVAQETALATVQPEQPIQDVSVFASTKTFEHAQRVAKMLSESDMIPQTFQKKIGNCVIALELANRIGASPMMVMQNLYIVHGKPAWSSKFLIATLNASGRFSPLQYEESDKDGGSTRAYATDKITKEKCYGAWVSMKMADAEGWINKNGSKWKTMPDFMRRYRAATFFVNQFAPEISMGIMTREEVIDTAYVEVEEETITPVEQAKKQTETERILSFINKAKDLATLNKHRSKLGDDKDLLQAFMDKEAELENAQVQTQG